MDKASVEVYLLNRSMPSQKLRQIIPCDKHMFLRKSCSKDIMAVAASDSAIGIDIEENVPRNAQTIEYYQKRFITFRIIDSRLTGLADFYKAWTAMESYFKLTGKGFYANKDFTFDLKENIVLINGNVAAYLFFVYYSCFTVCICIGANARISGIHMEDVL